MIPVWNFFIAYWLMIFWAFIGSAFVLIGIIKIVDEVRFRLERRRYQPARK